MSSGARLSGDGMRKTHYQNNYGPGRAIQLFAVLTMLGIGIWFPARILIDASRYGPDGLNYAQPFLWIVALVPLVTVGGAASIWYVRQIRIVISPEGIEYRTGLFSLSAPWSAALRIDQDRDWRGIPMEYLRLSQRARVGGLRWLVSDEMTWRIPLFMVTLRPYDFTEDLERYAPQLFAQREQRSP